MDQSTNVADSTVSLSELEEIRDEHTRKSGYRSDQGWWPDYCGTCLSVWPCKYIRLLDVVDQDILVEGTARWCVTVHASIE